jgi:glycopeptide antibiotics resistance protein
MAGWSLSIAITLTLFRGRYGSGSLAGLRKCAITSPVVLSGDGLTNLFLFAPAAFLMVLAISRPAKVLSGVALLSLAVEGIQAVWSMGVCDSSDALLNTLGASIATVSAVIARAAFARPGQSPMAGSELCPRSS